MKILLAHNRYNLIGGAELFYHEVGRVLQKNGHDVAYFSVQDEKNPDTPWSKYFPSAGDYQQKGAVNKILTFPKMVYSYEAKENFAKLIKDFKPDIVHVFAIYVGLTPSILDACKEANIPVVMSCNDYKHICPNYKLYHHGHLCEDCKGGKFHNAIVNKCCKDSIMFSIASCIEAYTHNLMNIYKKNIDIFLFAGEFMAHKTEEFWGKDTFQWKMLRNPYDSIATSIHTEYDDYILYLGRLVDDKGIDVIIKAMQYCPNIKLKIVGEGPEKENLEKLSQKLNLTNVEFMGYQDKNELNRILYNTRFVIVPSVLHENFPYVILEAFSAGKAVIGTNRGGIPELVRDNEFGLIYNAIDEKALASAIEKLWSDPERTLEMGINAKKWADNEFNDERFYSNLMNIYTEVLT